MARSFRSQKKQTRLQFQNLPSNSAAKDDYSSAVQDRLANVRYSGARIRHITPEIHGSSGLPTPEPSSATKVHSSSPLSSPPSSPNLPPQHTPRKPSTHEEDDDDDDIQLPSSKRRRLATAVRNATIASSPRRSARLGVSSPLQKATRISPQEFDHSTAHADKVYSNIGSAETSGDDAEGIVTQPTRRGGRRSLVQAHDPFVVNDDQINYLSPDEDVSVKRTRKAKKNDVDDFMVDDDEIEYDSSSNNDVTASSTRRKGKSQRRRSEHRSRKQQAELEEDLLDLRNSDQDDDVHMSRTRGGPVTTQRDEVKKHLARLKQRRAGKRTTRIIDSDDESNEETGHTSDSEGVDVDFITQDPAVRQRNSRTSSQTPSLIGEPELHPERFNNNTEDEADADFIVEDGDPGTSSRHRRPNPDIPLQFTSFASAKPKELFIHIIEWMVKNKVSPAFSRDDDLYSLSFNRVDDQVKAQAGSRLISSAWNANFKYAILARPTMTVEALPGLDGDHIRTCDACNRTNHPARYDFRFTGTPYHKDTLEPLEADEEEGSSSGDNDEDEDSATEPSELKDTQSYRSSKSYDSQGHPLPHQSNHFYLGRYCAAAAEMGHKLTHWKHHLNTDVLSHLSEQGVLAAEEIIRRDKKSHKKREKEAENIVDTMQDTGVVDELWKSFQADLEDARFGMEGHEGRHGKGRGKQRIGSIRVQGTDGRIGEWVEGGRYVNLPGAESDSDA